LLTDVRGAASWKPSVVVAGPPTRSDVFAVPSVKKKNRLEISVANPTAAPSRDDADEARRSTAAPRKDVRGEGADRRPRRKKPSICRRSGRIEVVVADDPKQYVVTDPVTADGKVST